ncbi:MAG: type II toxin-antitoxin system YafQ family toxin [Candidatus Peribacteraceae bacterium]|nr:type II toxin-antitoxin system YafQ family toxin [Candidatus Peribacteraceae bacterium]
MRKYDVTSTKRYKKDYKRLRKSGRDLGKLDRVIDTLARDEKLAEIYRDHALSGELEGRRECHIGPDWLLVYRKDKDALILLLLRTGTHRETLGIE